MIVQNFRSYIDYKNTSIKFEIFQPQLLLNRNFIDGYCYVCDKESIFFYEKINTSSCYYNWREQLVCQSCLLNNRKRASIHLFDLLSDGKLIGNLYIGEAYTKLYTVLSKRPGAIIKGSEFFGDNLKAGEKRWKIIDHYKIKKIQHENLQHLSFPNNSFNWFLIFDVLEHVPDFRLALKECHRCLRPGGNLFLSVPFDLNLEMSFPRAYKDITGKIVNLVNPEYHGDPINKNHRCLCFTQFGWSIISDLCECCFSDVKLITVNSNKYMYYGNGLIFVVATKKI